MKSVCVFCNKTKNIKKFSTEDLWIYKDCKKAEKAKNELQAPKTR